MINHVTQVIEKPIIAIVVDNSLSMMQHEDSTDMNRMFVDINKKIESIDFDPWIFNLEMRTELPIRFDASTNLTKPLMKFLKAQKHKISQLSY